MTIVGSDRYPPEGIANKLSKNRTSQLLHIELIL